MKKLTLFLLVLTLLPVAAAAQSVTGYVDQAALRAQVNETAQKIAQDNGYKLLEIFRNPAFSVDEKLKKEAFRLIPKADLSVTNDKKQTVLHLASKRCVETAPLSYPISPCAVLDKVLAEVVPTDKELLNKKDYKDHNFWDDFVEVIYNSDMKKWEYLGREVMPQHKKDFLLGKNAVNYKTRYLDADAPVRKYVRSIEDLLSWGADPTKEPQLLFYAVSENKMDLLETLLQSPEIRKKIDVETAYDKESFPKTPLYFAVKNNKFAMATKLLEAGADPKVGRKGHALLEAAIKTDNVEMLKLLLSYDAAKDNVIDNALLKAAIVTGNAEMLELLLSYDNVVKGKVIDDMLYTAVMMGRTECAAALFNAGGQVKDKIAILSIAASYSPDDLIETLLRRLNATPEQKAWVLCRILEPKEYDNIPIQRNYEKWYEWGRRDRVSFDGHCLKNGQTLLFWNVDMYLFDLADELLKDGASINAQDYEGYTILHRALSPAWNYEVEAKEIGTHYEEYSGYTLETPILDHKHVIVPIDKKRIKYLLSRGANVNIANNEEDTPLHTVLREYGDDMDVVKMLVEAGANVNAENDRGQTPLDLAKGDKMRTYLKRHGAR